MRARAKGDSMREFDVDGMLCDRAWRRLCHRSMLEYGRNIQ